MDTLFGRTQTPPPEDDRALTARIAAAYRLAAQTDLGSTDTFWLQEFAARKQNIHACLLAPDPAALRALLRAPIESDLLYGFENLNRTLADNPAEPEAHAAAMLDQLAQLCEAVGARRCRSPGHPEPAKQVAPLLDALDAALGVPVDFPNPFPGEYGLSSSRGVISYRAVQALYQAWRVRGLAPQGGVVEIGGGLGRTAYFAHRLGIADYTLIDLPMAGVAQASFLGRVLGEDAIRLFGETRPAPIALLPPVAFLTRARADALVLNVDSLTEMAPETARAYCAQTARNGSPLLSINHEVGRFRARDMFAAPCRSRAPYWLRQGYVEEISAPAAADANDH